MIETHRKHTAGPWRTNGYDVRQPVGRYVAYCGPHHTPDAEYPIACKLEDQANARLIAAAPELLAALVAMYNLDSGEAGATPSARNAVLALARMAIEQATNVTEL